MKKFYLVVYLIFHAATQIVSAEDNKPDTLRTYSLDEVIITSSTKETNDTKSLPASISILSPSQIDGMKVISIKDLSSIIPNFFIPDYGSRLSTPIYIRGIGERSTGQSISLYVDNMPYWDKTTFDFDFMDIQRIEILRGPQGTLYGRNSMSGIVNIFTHSPLDYKQTKFSLTGGSYELFRANASISRKICDKIGVSFSGYYDGNGGYFTNQYTGKKADQLSSAGGRFRLDWAINDNWKARLSAGYDYSDQGAFPYGAYKNGKIADPNYNAPGSYRREVAGGSFNLEYKNEQVVFNSTTGYQYFRDDMKMDLDNDTLSMFTMNQKQNENALTEELTIKSNNKNNYQWSFGAFGFSNSLRTGALTTMGQDGITYILQPVFDQLKKESPYMPKMTILSNEVPIPGTFKTPTYGGAIFHQSTYNNLFTNGLSITAGIRLDYEKTKLDYNTNMNMDLQVGSYPPSVAGDTLQGNESMSFTEALPKVALKYEFDNNHYVYFSAANGYKAGGYNIQMFADLMEDGLKAKYAPQKFPPVFVKDAVPYDPEYSWNYELGFKGEVIRNLLYAEATGFYIDVKDIQITQFVESGQGRMLTNAGRAVSKGFDLSLTARLFDGFSLSANYGYTHATFKNYQANSTDYSGKYVPYAPQNTFSLAALYDKRFQNKWIDKLNIQAQYNAAGRIYWTEANNVYQDFYGVLNLKAGIKKGIFGLSLWSRNTLNTDYAAFYFGSAHSQYAQRGKPLTVGVDLVVSF